MLNPIFSTQARQKLCLSIYLVSNPSLHLIYFAISPPSLANINKLSILLNLSPFFYTSINFSPMFLSKI